MLPCLSFGADSAELSPHSEEACSQSQQQEKLVFVWHFVADHIDRELVQFSTTYAAARCSFG